MSLSLSEKAAAVKPSSTLSITAKAKALAEAGADVVSFSAGEPDFDTPANVKQAAIKAIEEGFTKYTDAAGMLPLKKAVCTKFESFNHLQYEPNQIVISNGGKHSLANIFSALLNPGDEVIIPAPFWLSYPEIVRLAGGVPVYVYADASSGYKVTAAQISAACTSRTKALILNSPNNPTGAVYTSAELSAIAEVVVSKDIYAVSDEMYEYFLYTDSPYVSIASLGSEIYDRTITCSGMSKSYSMTGWRIGYTGSTVQIAKMMGSVQSHQTSNPNSIAQKASIEALLGPQDSVKQMHEAFVRRRDLIFKLTNACPHIKAAEPEGAFYLFVDLREALKLSYKGEVIGTASDFARILIEDYNVAIVPCEDFGADGHMRLSYAIFEEQIVTGMGRIEKLLKILE
jgi:aspartate aminotransferase